jgi:hypothetical protein
MIGIEAFVCRWIGVMLVKGQKLMEPGCPCTPMSNNEQRCLGDLRLSQPPSPYERLQVAEGGIYQGSDADKH